mgnify:CR=1 FL=1
MALCEICDGEFPRKNSSTYCSVACANAARVIHADQRRTPAPLEHSDHDAVRRAILASGAPDLMSTWTRSAWGADDYQMWQAQRAALKPGSPLFPLVDGQISRLDREFGP